MEKFDDTFQSQEQYEQEIADRVTEMAIDLNVALDYIAGDGVLRLSKFAAIARAKNALQPSQTLVELFEGLPSGTEIKLTPTKKNNVWSIGMNIRMPE